jgi:hypothetical protein
MRCAIIQRLLRQIFPTIADATGLVMPENDTLIFVLRKSVPA